MYIPPKGIVKDELYWLPTHQGPMKSQVYNPCSAYHMISPEPIVTFALRPQLRSYGHKVTVQSGPHQYSIYNGTAEITQNVIKPHDGFYWITQGLSYI